MACAPCQKKRANARSASTAKTMSYEVMVDGEVVYSTNNYVSARTQAKRKGGRLVSRVKPKKAS